MKERVFILGLSSRRNQKSFRGMDDVHGGWICSCEAEEQGIGCAKGITSLILSPALPWLLEVSAISGTTHQCCVGTTNPPTSTSTGTEPVLWKATSIMTISFRLNMADLLLTEWAIILLIPTTVQPLTVVIFRGGLEGQAEWIAISQASKCRTLWR